MKALRRYAYLALTVACLHLVFGAIVRISGSGMGCGDNWPKCFGYWFPPLSRPDLIIEVSHRYLASIVTLTIVALFVAAWRRRREPGVSGPGGVLRMAGAAVVTVVCVAILGGVTVKLGNAPWATVAHWTLAMTLLAILATAAVRSGAMGGVGARAQTAPRAMVRGGYAAASIAFLVVAMGGLTANYPFGAMGCTTFPFCGANPAAPDSAVHIQLTHRALALLLGLVSLGLALRARRADVGPVVRRAAYMVLAFVILQVIVAAAMVLLHLPPVLRSLHEAVGVGVWLSAYTMAYLARIAARPRSPAEVGS